LKAVPATARPRSNAPPSGPPDTLGGLVLESAPEPTASEFDPAAYHDPQLLPVSDRRRSVRGKASLLIQLGTLAFSAGSLTHGQFSGSACASSCVNPDQPSGYSFGRVSGSSKCSLQSRQYQLPPDRGPTRDNMPVRLHSGHTVVSPFSVMVLPPVYRIPRTGTHTRHTSSVPSVSTHGARVGNSVYPQRDTSFPVLTSISRSYVFSHVRHRY